MYVYLAKQAREAHAPVRVVVARHDIATGTIMNAGMVEMKSVPRDMLPPNPAIIPAEVEGQVALAAIPAGNVVSTRQIAAKSRLSHIIPPFMRAVTVALDPIIGVGGFLKPGDHVDVIATFQVNDGTLTKTVLQDVELLATGAEVVAEPSTGGGGQEKAKTQPNATLAVNPMDAEKLILSEAKGKLRLALRRADDASFVRTRGVTGRQVMGIVPPDSPERTRVASAGASAPRPAASRPIMRETPPLPWQIGPVEGPSAASQLEGRKVQVVRGTKIEETVVSE
jgi:pilus assembly protein CpaB